MPARKSIPRRLASTYGPLTNIELTPPYCLELEIAEPQQVVAEELANLGDRGYRLVQNDKMPYEEDGVSIFPSVQVAHTMTSDQPAQQTNFTGLNFGHGAFGVTALANDTSPLSDLDAMIRENARRKPAHTYTKRSRTTLSKSYMQVDLALARRQEQPTFGNAVDPKSHLNSQRIGARSQLRMVPNINLTFKADHPPENSRARTHSRVTAQWSDVIDSTLLTNETERRSGGAAYSEAYIDPNSCETPSRAPFTAFNSKHLRETASKVCGKESSKLDTSKKRVLDSDSVYRALRFVELDISKRDTKQKGNVERTSPKKATLKRSGENLGSRYNTVRLHKRTCNAVCVSHKGAERRHQEGSVASPLAFHGRRHNGQSLATTQLQVDLACDASMDSEPHEPVPSLVTGERPRSIATTETSEFQIGHGSRKVATALTTRTTDSDKSKPLSTMIEQPEMLLHLLKQAELYKVETPIGIPIRRPKRVKSTQSHDQNSEYVGKSAPAAAVYHSNLSQKKALAETGTAYQTPSVVAQNQNPTMPSCRATHHSAVVRGGEPDLPELFAQKYKLLPLPSMDLEVQISEEQLPSARLSPVLPIVQTRMPSEGQKHAQLFPRLHTPRAPVKGNTSTKSSARLAGGPPDDSK